MIEFKLPSLGADMDEGTVVEWKVAPGDQVEKGQVVVVVDTSKTMVDVEIWQPGTVSELLVQPGVRIPVGTPLALLLEPGEAPGQALRPLAEAVPGPAAAAPAPPAPPVAAARTPDGGRRLISPAARKHAEELGVDIAAVTGTGPHGAVTLEDVVAASRPAAPPPAAAGDKQAEMRRAIAAAMGRSKREIPHYYLAETVALGRALAWLRSENERRGMADRLLPAALLLKAVALALARYPELNGYFKEGGFVAASGIHVGVAISLRQGGLIAPAILDADRLSLAALMQALTDLVKRARAGSLKSSELSEASITVTNLGDQGVDAVYGVIYPPQVALVGFGRIAERPWVEDGRMAAMPTVTASLSADHRVSDGHRGALFLAELRERLQRPEELDAGGAS